MRVLRKIKHALIPDWLRKKYYAHLSHKHYVECMNMPENEYEEYLCRRYAEMMNRIDYTKGLKMDFENPTTYTQKQQWLKLYDYSEKKSVYSDKYAVREHIKNVLGEEYLIPLIDIDGKDCFTDPEEIDFNKLPNQFVIKCNHGSHYNIIVKDKSSLSKKDIKNIKKQLKIWLKEHYAFLVGMELVYETIPPRITIEKFMSINDDLPDYKFMCFSGEVKYVWCDQGRFGDHRRSVFDLDYNLQPFNLYNLENVKDMKKPDNFDEMVKIAKKLCEDFPYVRVDLYNIEGKIYFGELTFCSGAGYQAAKPLEYEKVLGDLIRIDKSKRENNFKYRKR